MEGFWTILVCFLPLFELCSGRIGFIKDQSLDSIIFPPKITKSIRKTIPIGHLRPLGWQRAPDSKVIEELEILAPQEFYSRYVNRTKPVVFRNAISDVPAMQNWKDEYLRNKYGSLNIHVVVKKEQFKQGPRKMTFKNFLKEYNFDDWYLTNIIPHEMMEELTFPKCLKCGMSNFLQESGIWMTSGGTASLLHSHADENLHCLLSGKKDFILINPKYKAKLYYQNREPHIGAGYSEMDMDMINMFKYDKVSEVPWTWATIHPGDCIYVPSTYLHQVRSYGRSFSSTILWAPSPDTDFSDCPKNNAGLNTIVPLKEAPFIWTYLRGDRELANMRLDGSSLKHHLVVWMRNETGLRYDVLKDYYDEIMSELKEEEKPSMAEIWTTLAGSLDVTSLTREEVKALPDEALNTVAQFLNMPHVLHGHYTAKDEL